MAKHKQAKTAEEPTLETTEIKGVVKVLRVTPYEGISVMIRQIYEEYFEYVFMFEGQFYGSYIIAKMAEGQKKLTEQEVQEASALIYNGAMATIDVLTGKEVDDKTKEYVELFESKREAVETALEKEKKGK